jgi:hypothetical protein
MRFQIVLLGAILCLGAAAQGQTTNPDNKNTQSANRVKRPDAGTAQSVTGCVDEQNGHYVLRDVQTSQLITLQPSSASADDDFARFVGHQAQASGTLSSGTLTVAHIGLVADMCPVGK